MTPPLPPPLVRDSPFGALWSEKSLHQIYAPSIPPFRDSGPFLLFPVFREKKNRSLTPMCSVCRLTPSAEPFSLSTLECRKSLLLLFRPNPSRSEVIFPSAFRPGTEFRPCLSRCLFIPNPSSPSCERSEDAIFILRRGQRRGLAILFPSVPLLLTSCKV